MKNHRKLRELTYSPIIDIKLIEKLNRTLTNKFMKSCLG